MARSSSTGWESSAATNAGSMSRWIRSVGITSRISDDRLLTIGPPPYPASSTMSGQRGVRIDRPAVRTTRTDLEMQMGGAAVGIARVADVTDELAPRHRPPPAAVVAQVPVVKGVPLGPLH